MDEILDFFTTENVKTIVLVTSIILAFLSEWKRRGFLKALMGVMRTIEKTKVKQCTKEKVDAAITIAGEIKKDWNKESEVRSVKKTGELIDQVYDNHVKVVNDWLPEYEEKIKCVEIEEGKEIKK